ncbi:biofilm regulation phosphoprotein SiaC [Panacagrimonas sp.]|uniref:biofilm regulation phosphoprotein SiaC n=1 Tax=Panacagrimonas sp. TaxID=2480088 RepID=UPI003B527328
MDDLNIAPTQSTPAVRTGHAAGVMELRGDSYPENAFQFFEPVYRWVDDFLTAGAGPLLLKLHLVYMNTSSVKSMMDIFDRVEDAHKAGHEVALKWYYNPENERVAELAAEFKEDYAFPFEILPEAS